MSQFRRAKTAEKRRKLGGVILVWQNASFVTDNLEVLAKELTSIEEHKTNKAANLFGIRLVAQIDCSASLQVIKHKTTRIKKHKYLSTIDFLLDK